MEKFKQLGVTEVLLDSLRDLKIEEPTEIQEKAIPLVLGGKDIIAGSATGSGKTLAFGASIVMNCAPGAGLQSLVLVPTRELAEQVAKSLHQFSKYKKLEIAAVYGGVSINPQFRDIDRADVVVGTPGRILDHIERRSIDLSGIKILVLDEADRMLDMGFIRDVEKILSHCSKYRQTLLFSATIGTEISRLAKRYMNNPVEVSAEDQVDPSKLKQVYYDVPDSTKFALLVHLLKKEHKGLVMVFCNTQHNTDFVARNLSNLGVDAVAIHGGLSQDKRSRIMSQFHSKDVNVLVCTDVAARGLDIKGVSHVYNYDVPNENNNYVHRIGRTARAGADGIAITILASRDYEQFGKLLKSSTLKIERQELPEVQRVPIIVQERRHHGGRFSRAGDRGHGGGRFNRHGGSRSRDNRGSSRGSRFGSRFGGRSRDRRHSGSRNRWR
ncbi:DEAD/DEAH box helicase [Candidatus Pacearchaeota archaeon]|nr:DEAD/DEAH box helicase [Candidatus Pacearchaeota archaeon]